MSADQYVMLKGGLTVPVAALKLALALEARGIPLATDKDHQFISPSDTKLTTTDRFAMLRWRNHLSAIVEYRAPEIS